MRLVATIEIALFYFTAFGLRSLWQWLKTGKTGFVGIRKEAGPWERTAVLLMAVAMVLGPIAPWVGPLLFEKGHWVGVIVAALGVLLTLVAQVEMGASWRIGVDASERTTLVTSGIFALVRNPIFSAMLLTTVGLAVAAPTPLALALPWALLVGVEIQVRHVEEPYLIRVHGEPYLAWAARTGRFVPGLGRLRP